MPNDQKKENSIEGETALLCSSRTSLDSGMILLMHHNCWKGACTGAYKLYSAARHGAVHAGLQWP